MSQVKTKGYLFLIVRAFVFSPRLSSQCGPVYDNYYCGRPVLDIASTSLTNGPYSEGMTGKVR